ncbi:hypothetical protein NC652_027606 [Populus alba x Populus x berolinensis]|nr:hypothetical protein NC652_027606 [Populus alba x Populus x berolinensis]
MHRLQLPPDEAPNNPKEDQPKPVPQAAARQGSVNFSDQIENGHSHNTNGTVFRSCSSPSSSGVVSGSNGLEAVSNGWYSLAIKPEKMREREEEKKDITKKSLEKDRTEERIDKELSFLYFFSKKQRRPWRETTSSGGRKQLAHQSSIMSPFLCFQRGSNTGNTTRRKNRNCLEGGKFSAPVSSHRNRGVRASRS